MSFTPTILDLGITYGTIVTYRFNTTIVVLGDGSEQRIIRWNQPLARYQIGQRDVDGDTLDTLLAFFNARQGSYQGFLFKDWADYRYGGGASKTYTADGETVTRAILHPDIGGETFTVPVRFEQDKIDFRFKAYRPGDGARIFTLENLSLVEIRQAPETPLELDPLPGTLGLLDLGYDYETTGGPVFSTSTAGNNAGWENRRANWETPKGRWNIGDRTLNSTELAELIAWFRVCRGAAVPWTFKNWQTEQEVIVRFAQDEISFRFDAYRSSDEEAIWQLSGLEVVATELAAEPPPPPPANIDSTTYVITLIDASGSMDSAIPAIEESVNQLRQMLLEEVYLDEALANKYVKEPINTPVERYLESLVLDYRDSPAEPEKYVFLVFQNEAAIDYHGPDQNLERDPDYEPTAIYLSNFAAFVDRFADYEKFYCVILIPTSAPPFIYESSFNAHVFDAVSGNIGYEALANYGFSAIYNMDIESSAEQIFDIISGFLP